LEKNQVGLTVPDEGKKAAKVGPLVGIEAEDGEERGHSLSILPRERLAVKCAAKAAS